MIIELAPPFKKKWIKGYLRQSKDGRMRVDLFNSNSDRTTITYARYLMCVKLGYELRNDLEVDHKNGDHSNDNIENLEVLSKEDHRAKSGKENTMRCLFVCPVCGKELYLSPSRVKIRKTCSSSCNMKRTRQSGKHVGAGVKIDKDHAAKEIRKLRKLGYSDYKIAPTLGVSRSTVLNIRKNFKIV